MLLISKPSLANRHVNILPSTDNLALVQFEQNGSEIEEIKPSVAFLFIFP